MNNMEEGSICRILDANLNRAQEGLRVCEEYVRFALEDPVLSQELKNLRHRLQEAERIIRDQVGEETTAEPGYPRGYRHQNHHRQ